MQKVGVIQPKFLNFDSAYAAVNPEESLKPNESPWIKDLTWDFNENPVGTTIGQGANQFSLTPVASNRPIPFTPISGYKRTIGSFYSETTQETYFFVYSGTGNHAIYVVYGNSETIDQVIVDPNLQFTDNQNGELPSHRVSMRTFLDKTGKVVEKILLITDGNSWQKWILVNASIQTNGFDPTLFPYWSLRPPHFDRRELLEWAMRPPMYKPIVQLVPNTPDDIDKINRIIDTAIQVAFVFQNTDGRRSVFSPYSEPLINKSEDFLNNPDNLPKNALFTFYAGSPLTESIDIYIRKNALNLNSIPSITEWSDWYKYDTIYKFSDSTTSTSSVIGTPYWTRTNAWSKYNYDPNLNTIQYSFDNSKVLQIIDQNDAATLQNDIPQQSAALTDLGDAEALSNNRRDYDNLPASMISKLSIQVAEKPNQNCNIPTRTIQLYAYVGMGTDNGWYISQVGYFNGSDTQMRFGGLNYGSGTTAGIDFNISKTFDLTFADTTAFRCYLKGTPYFTTGIWYQVNSDFSLVKIPNLLDFSNTDVLAYIRNVYISGGFFVCVFTFTVPAGRYIATIGRHNVNGSGDFKGTSTYIYGIANSRITTPINAQTVTVKPNAIVSFSKEVEIDCTSSNIDAWGNGYDLFYIYCPYISTQNFRFIEGYLQESTQEPIGMELYPYTVVTGSSEGANDWGKQTDKNGFYWAYVVSDHAGISDVHIRGNINCVVTDFDIKTAQGGEGWRPNPTAYFSDHNGGIVGDCNRVLLNGRITNLDGSIGYSNIAISIKDGATVLSGSDGFFTLIIHNGEPSFRNSNVYINAGGNFLISIANCGYLPITQYQESLIPCSNCNKRVYPIPLNISIQIQNTSQTSLKQGGRYSNGFVLADLAGRMTFVQIESENSVPSFIERQDTLATFFKLLINGPLQIGGINPDFKWFAPYVSKNLTESSYIQWVGDNIKYIDNQGNVVSDPASAVYCSIAIDSLYNYNISRNFSTLANYQFKIGDRLRIYDDGKGNLLTGNPIDLRILGQNYNEAAVTAGLLPNNSTAPVINNNISSSSQTSVNNGTGTTTISVQTDQNNKSITLFVLFDPRLTPLINDIGFWIEIYTPAEQSSILTFSEIGGFYPIISGEIANFTGFSGGAPTYSFPASIDIDFWDTYLFPRSITIPNVGDKFFSHPFESPNISDTFGYNITSGGRQNVNNNNAKQMWYVDETIKSDDFVSEGILNGIGRFRSSNRKTFKDFKSGGIVATKALRNLVAFICENDYFITDYNYQYIFANAQGVSVANLDNNLGTPHQKVGDSFGCAYEDTATILFYDRYVIWYDYKNEALVQMGWGPAIDVTSYDESKGSVGYVKSYFIKKTQFVKDWNSNKSNAELFDVYIGVDPSKDNVYISFRPRRNNSNDVRSYINRRREKDVSQQETIVYSIKTRRFHRFVSFVPEAYGIIKGIASGLKMISFSAGAPYIHDGQNGFSNFYGVDCQPSFASVFNENSGMVKVLQNISVDIKGGGYYVDSISSEENGSFSYIPSSWFKTKENQLYAPVLRNMSSYPAPNIAPDNLYRSTLTDNAGKRVFGRYFVCRFVCAEDSQGVYSEIQGVYYGYIPSESIKK